MIERDQAAAAWGMASPGTFVTPPGRRSEKARRMHCREEGGNSDWCDHGADDGDDDGGGGDGGGGSGRTCSCWPLAYRAQEMDGVSFGRWRRDDSQNKYVCVSDHFQTKPTWDVYTMGHNRPPCHDDHVLSGRHRKISMRGVPTLHRGMRRTILAKSSC